MINLLSIFVLCIQLFSVNAGRAPFRGRRLETYDTVVEKLPLSCTSSEYVCEVQDPQFEFPDEMTAEAADDLVAYFCCAIRKDSRKQLMSIAPLFNAACKTEAFVDMEKVEDKSPSQTALLLYCDDLVTGEPYKNEYRSWLWELVKFEDRVQLHSCSKENADPHAATYGWGMACGGLQDGLCENEPQCTSCRFSWIQGENTVDGDCRCYSGPGIDEVTVHINGFNYNDGIVHASIELEEDEIYSWGPSVDDYGLESALHLVQNSYGSELMDGVKGEMFVTSTDKISAEKSFTISGVNKQAIRKRLEEIKEDPPLYSFINFNCAHAVLEALAEGLGCKSKLLPFFSPIALAEIIDESVLTGEIYENRRFLTSMLLDTAQTVSRLLNLGN